MVRIEDVARAVAAQPAAQGVPPRIKRMPSEMLIENNFNLAKVKKCPQFIDALTCGYLIPAVADVIFTMDAQGLSFKAELPIVENHDIRQLAGTDLQRLLVVKFLNPWIVKTPPGYSCLFLALASRSSSGAAVAGSLIISLSSIGRSASASSRLPEDD